MSLPFWNDIDWFPIQLSFRVAAIATFIALVVGLSCGWLLARKRFWGKEFLDSLITLPLVLPPTVLGYYLLVMLGNRSPIGQFIQNTFGTRLTFTVTAAVIAASIHALPLFVKAVRAAFEQVSPQLEQAARLMGASEWRVFRTVTLPLGARTVLAATTLAFARALGDFGVTIMIAGNIPGKTQTAAVAIYDAVQAGKDAQAGALVLIVSILAILLLYITNRISAKALW
ncbi:molybdate ABC transporter permease subunit [Candidatus Acetothermia bacterium]|nr:molybdate ABC transporter permease subunit [Candidatus Acetothermia bacterium]MBI3643293.1 molybdate ABC transporter permease subunit [Candidatus Acetothermia bacterium]